MKTVTKLTQKEVMTLMLHKYSLEKVSKKVPDGEYTDEQLMLMAVIDDYAGETVWEYFTYFYPDFQALKSTKLASGKKGVSVDFDEDKEEIMAEMEQTRLYVLDKISNLIRKSGALQQGLLF